MPSILAAPIPVGTGDRNRRVDIEARYMENGRTGKLRSRALQYTGRFTSRMTPPLGIELRNDKIVLVGAVRRPEVFGGSVEHEGKGGGEFELRALPDTYGCWWQEVMSPKSQARKKPPSGPFSEMLKATEPKDVDGSSVPSEKGASSDTGVVVVRGQPVGKSSDDESDEDANGGGRDELVAQLFDMPLLNILGGGKKARDGSSKADKAKAAFAQIRDFSMRPDEVKTYLDRFVVKQDTAKEMLAVAICDHYNRAREDLAGQKALRFKDTDGDVVELRLVEGVIQEFLNGKVEIEDVKKFEVDEESRMYVDDTGRGSFEDGEDLKQIVSKRDALFAEAGKIKEQAEKGLPQRSKNYTKPNVLLLGPTGSGKTYLLKTLSDLVGVPFVKADATKFTETGYVGRDAEDVMRELLSLADGDAQLAQVGMVYIDEIDKVCAGSGGTGNYSSFRRGTQSTFLKLMEDTEVSIRSSPMQRMLPQSSDRATKLSTRHVLFVFSGAFSQLDKQLQDEHKRESRGFGFGPAAADAPVDVSAELQSLLHKAGTEELVKAGLEPEFVGRIPVRVALGALSEEDLFSILAHAEEGPVGQLTDDFRRYGLDVQFTDEALRAVASRAVKEGTGARSLVTILEGSMRRFKFHMPSLLPYGCRSFQVTKAVIESPEEELQRLLEQYPATTKEDDLVVESCPAG